MGYDSAESQLPAFIRQLAVLPPGEQRTDFIDGAERFGRWAVPTLVDCLNRGSEAEAAQIWNVLTRMILAEHTAHGRAARGQLGTSDLALGANRLEVRELLLVYRAVLGRKEQGAARCRAKSIEILLERARDRAVAEPIFRELGLEANRYGAPWPIRRPSRAPWRTRTRICWKPRSMRSFRSTRASCPSIGSTRRGSR